MADLYEFHDGIETRRLGLLEQPVETLKYAWPVLGESDGAPPLIPREQWQEVSLRPLVREIQNQANVGMCASSGTVNTVEVARNLAGLDYVPLSAGDLYRRVCVNGGDNGSLPEDNLEELLRNGIAPVSDVPYLEWRREVGTANRARYRGLEAWRLATTVHVASALQHGFPCLIGYFHQANDNPGRDGWMDSPSGGRGGHAVCVIGLKKRGNEWGFEFENSWTTRWGMGGYAVLPESRLAYGLRSFSAWALRATVQESGNLPPLKV